MAKDPAKPAARAKKGGRARRSVVTIRRQPLRTRLSEWVHSPPIGWGVLIGLAFVLACGALVVWTRAQPTVAIGRVMDRTRTVRFPFETEDLAATEGARELARNDTPRVYVTNADVLQQIEDDLVNLPRTLSGVESLDAVDAAIRGAFRLTDEGLAAIQEQAENGEPTDTWLTAVDELVRRMRLRPILDEQTWQRATQEGGHDRIELRYGEGDLAGQPRLVTRGDEINAGNPEQIEEAARQLTRQAGFTGPARAVAIARLIESPQPTFRFDTVATANKQNQASDAIETITREAPRGAVVFARGETLTPAQFETYRAELAAYRDQAGGVRIWLRRAGLLGAVAAVTLAVGAYTGLFVPRIRRSPARMGGLAAVLGVALIIACVGAVAAPAWTALTITAPTLLATALLALAYDRRAAMAYGGVLAVLIALALDRTTGQLALLLFGVAVAAWRLDDVRTRHALVSAGAWTGLALALGVIGVGAIERPLASNVWTEVGMDAAIAGFSGLLTGVTLLAALPWIERAFNFTTPLTLIDLRDPKQPLLKELQRRAPGTYNHSLNVSSIAEAASDAIGADPLLTYVGGLYHDIGKMNKPEYFVENQSGGPNKHDKLAPAMSLLVIIGHVKDGLEMARANDLPRQLHHFIDGHHGTTLVEFFYHRAKTQAAEAEASGESDAETPEELEYRYPGPRPQTKEVAMLMLADAVESATRAMPEPTPSRIDQLVRDLARKRLLDGQFDQCDLSFRELNLAVEAISKTVASIYHGRIAYPAGDKAKDKGEAKDEGGEQKRA